MLIKKRFYIPDIYINPISDVGILAGHNKYDLHLLSFDTNYRAFLFGGAWVSEWTSTGLSDIQIAGLVSFLDSDRDSAKLILDKDKQVIVKRWFQR